MIIIIVIVIKLTLMTFLKNYQNVLWD